MRSSDQILFSYNICEEGEVYNFLVTESYQLDFAFLSDVVSTANLSAKSAVMWRLFHTGRYKLNFSRDFWDALLLSLHSLAAWTIGLCIIFHVIMLHLAFGLLQLVPKEQWLGSCTKLEECCATRCDAHSYSNSIDR